MKFEHMNVTKIASVSNLYDQIFLYLIVNRMLNIRILFKFYAATLLRCYGQGPMIYVKLMLGYSIACNVTLLNNILFSCV